MSCYIISYVFLLVFLWKANVLNYQIIYELCGLRFDLRLVVKSFEITEVIWFDGHPQQFVN